MCKEFKLKINNKNWKIKFVDPKYLKYSYGECDDAYDVGIKKPEIWIRNDLSEKDKIDTLVHEVLHAVRPELCEEAVDYTASVICEAISKAYPNGQSV